MRVANSGKMKPAAYQEFYRFPAALLAVLVHGVFFALLYFGFSWQSQPPEAVAMTVELWGGLPVAEPEIEKPLPEPVEEVLPVEPVKPVEEIKPDIVIPDKKPVKKIEVKLPEKKPEVKPPEKKAEVKPQDKKPDIKPVDKKAVLKPAKADEKPQAKGEVKAAPQKPVVSAAELQAERDRLEMEAATARIVDEYSGKIKAKVRSNTVLPPNVENEARAEFMVTLLPGGRVLNARLLKSSGNVAYDEAVERAILRSDPLPLPADTSLFSRFRELKLRFKPVE